MPIHTGTMSAWYVWSALGLYPLTGTDVYFIGSPVITSATSKLHRGGLNVNLSSSTSNTCVSQGISSSMLTTTQNLTYLSRRWNWMVKRLNYRHLLSYTMQVTCVYHHGNAIGITCRYYFWWSAGVLDDQWTATKIMTWIMRVFKLITIEI